MGEAAEPQTREGTAAPQPRAARGLLTERGARKDLRSSMKNPRSDRTWEVSHGEWRRWDTAFLWGWDAGPCPPAPQPHPIILDPVALTLGEAPCPFIPGSAQGDGHSRGAQAPGCVWGGRGGALGPCPPAAPPPPHPQRWLPLPLHPCTGCCSVSRSALPWRSSRSHLSGG